MNVFAKFDEIPSMTLQDIKETKRYGHTCVRSVVRSDNVKTVYPPTNTVCGGYKYSEIRTSALYNTEKLKGRVPKPLHYGDSCLSYDKFTYFTSINIPYVNKDYS